MWAVDTGTGPSDLAKSEGRESQKPFTTQEVPPLGQSMEWQGLPC
jgi:hypothetical protein